jgi:ParB-like chromosome segregation protein Spo0J
MSEEDTAARHFVTPAVVKQRLRLASVSPKLHDVYAEDGMTLEQLMAFAVTADHPRQDQVWENVSRSGYDEPYQIRRMLTENTVRASDRRKQFVGLDVYEQAGVLRDLFELDDGGLRQDVALLDRLATEKLKADAKAIGAEGWKWISVTGRATNRDLRPPDRVRTVAHAPALDPAHHAKWAFDRIWNDSPAPTQRAIPGSRTRWITIGRNYPEQLRCRRCLPSVPR